MNEYDVRVSNGIRFLSAVKPLWRDSINLDSLSMSNMYDCVIGQTLGYFSDVFTYDAEPQAFARYLGVQALSHAENDECEDDELGRCSNKLGNDFGCYELECAFLENAWRDRLKV